MAFVFGETFDGVSAIGELAPTTESTVLRWNLRTGGTLIASSRTANALRMDAVGNFLQRDLAADGVTTEFIAGVAYKPNAITGTAAIFSVRDSADGTLHMVRRNAAKIECATDAATPTQRFISAADHFVAGEWRYVEWRYVIADSGGVLEVRVIDTTGAITVVGTFTGDTKLGTGSNLGDFRIGKTFSAAAAGDAGASDEFDDFYVVTPAGTRNTTYLGDVTGQVVRPMGEGSSNDWLGSDGDSEDNHLLVDEAATDTGDYVSAALDDAEDAYLTGNPSRPAGHEIVAVQTNVHAAYLSSAKSIAMLSRSGALEMVGDDQALTTTPSHYHDVFEVADDTAETGEAEETPWTFDLADAAEFGFRLRP